MSAKDDGGPAFPKWLDSRRPISAESQDAGMSMRDYFATAALQGLLSGAAFSAPNQIDSFSAATQAYEISDAMIKERAK